ncbi:MAG TPA: acyltransferase [Candidatus Sulfotelmatobacter sp.]|nr:acyltransferase [Candidatus Sulfotelmatobacter sp.]
MRIHSLQGLRAACIPFVVLAHLSRTHNCFHSVVVERYGNLGVRIFLVLSGYLITSQLVKERTTTGGISLKRFYARRAYRIFPAAYVFMIVAIVTHWRLLSATNIVTALTYTVNYCQHGNHVLGRLWSLGVEEQFYLVWPLCLLLFFRNRLWIVGSVIAAGPPFRLLFWMFWGRAGLEHPFPVFMDALAMGAAVALLAPKLKQFQGALASRWFLVVPTATFLLPLIQFWDSGVYQTIGLTALHLRIALSLRHVMERRYWLLNSLPVMWLGAISYSLYLQLFLDRWSTAPWAAFPLNILLAMSLAAASYHFVEQPGLKLRRSSGLGGSTPPPGTKVQPIRRVSVRQDCSSWLGILCCTVRGAVFEVSAQTLPERQSVRLFVESDSHVSNVSFVGDVVPLEHRCRLVTADLHRHRFRHSQPAQVAHASAT